MQTKKLLQPEEVLRKAQESYKKGYLHLKTDESEKAAACFQEAVVLYRALADQGDAAAQYNLGYCYENAVGITQDDLKAAEYYRLAADQGHVAAQYTLGCCYDNAVGVAQDTTMAVKYYQLAANQGCASAQYNLGICYENGIGVPQDIGKAVKFFKKAADQEEPNSEQAIKSLVRFIFL